MALYGWEALDLVVFVHFDSIVLLIQEKVFKWKLILIISTCEKQSIKGHLSVKLCDKLGRIGSRGFGNSSSHISLQDDKKLSFMQQKYYLVKKSNEFPVIVNKLLVGVVPDMKLIINEIIISQ